MKLLVTCAAAAALAFSTSAVAEAAPGSIDAGFGTNGRVVLSPSPGQKMVVRDMVRTPDGKLLLSGGATPDQNGFLYQLLPDGSPDPAFGDGDGLVLTPTSQWSKLSFQGERIIAFGRVGPNAAVARFEADGTLDESFADQGIASLDVLSRFGELEEQTLETTGPGIDSQGRIVAGVTVLGCTTKRPAAPAQGRHRCGNVLLFRLSPDGLTDESYGDGGLVTIAAGRNPGERPSALGMDRKDRILVRSRDSVFYGEPQPTRDDVLQRFSATGEYDRGFGDDGLVSLGIWAGEVAVTNRGRIIEAPDRTYLVTTSFFRRVGRTGRLFPSEQTWAVAEISKSRSLSMSDVELDGRGRMIISGTANSGGKRQFVVSRYERDGTLDATWTRDGVATAGLGDRLSNDLMRQRRGIIEAASVIEPDGGVTVAATSIRDGRWQIELRRFAGGEGEPQYCKGRRATIVGTSGDDVIEGGFDSVIVAGPGDDKVKAGLKSLVCLGPGNDEMRGGGNWSSVHGGTGDDLIRAGGRIEAGPGRDTIRTIHASSARVLAGPGADYVVTAVATGDSVVDGGPGADLLRNYATEARLRGGPGDDRLIGGRLADVLDGGPGDDILEGNSLPDRLFGRDGDDHLSGGNGPDLLVGGKGDDSIDPGPPIADRQTYTVDNRKARGKVWMDGNRWAAGRVSVWYRCSGWNHGTVRDGFHESSTFDESLAFDRRGRAEVEFDLWDGFGFYADGWMKARKTDRHIYVTYWGKEDFSYGEDGSFKCRTGLLKFHLTRVPGDRDIVRP
jgi:uncharacterized delta-60 repeat protein